MRLLIPLLVLAFVLLAGCTSPDGQQAGGTADRSLVGEWSARSESLFYDAGGRSNPDMTVTSSRRLVLKPDGAWEFGSSSGTWSISAIIEGDWEKWEISSYGPSRKIVLDGWSGTTASGPIEESNDRVDFFWVIYRVEPPVVSEPGQMQIKFGRVLQNVIFNA
ncbi:hypothetical protein HY546_03430 [archaeon]|nr:hypothetical protein [archaeon]